MAAGKQQPWPQPDMAAALTSGNQQPTTCAGGLNRVGQHLQNAGRIAYLTEAGAFRFSEHLHASYGTTRKYISERETVFLVRGMAQSGEGREDAKDMKVCQ